ncbi:hypothetical protein ACFO5R_03490 [Halosolutus amylolyticus]|uniref:Uncharacterized protein n=1 Tax=Halosolutus amylolyticus TaxID=2932267 RepID=A0ABD5PLT7_9EURY|nr:hypothetical protein [Halosolutus amylolyticus]
MAQHTKSSSSGTDAVDTSGWFYLDPVSKLMVAGCIAGILGIYVPVLYSPELTVGGLPWMFVSKPIVGLALAGSFVGATYYVDFVHEGGD